VTIRPARPPGGGEGEDATDAGPVAGYAARLSRPALAPVPPGLPDPPAIDELIGPDGEVRPAQRDLAASLDLLGITGLLTRRAQARRFVEDDGVTYGVPTADPSVQAASARRWAVDPLPLVIGADEWAGLETALAQRALLLDAVLADLYGQRALLRTGTVPAEVVLADPGFLRTADGIRPPAGRSLFLTATDLGRGPDGRWLVLGDRTQAPSGAGYAMENRRVVSRVLPGLYRGTRLARLREFFHLVRAGLQEAAPDTADAPRVVLLTPGAGAETAFDQAFLATLLGHPWWRGRT
jgi:uncharacterized circularly permuted ATP-grasp superfamily protein